MPKLYKTHPLGIRKSQWSYSAPQLKLVKAQQVQFHRQFCATRSSP